MNRRRFMNTSALGLAGIATGMVGCKTGTFKSARGMKGINGKLNILIVIADDAGWKDFGYHGSEMKTTFLDKIVKESVELDWFYVSPTCSPHWPLQ